MLRSSVDFRICCGAGTFSSQVACGGPEALARGSVPPRVIHTSASNIGTAIHISVPGQGRWRVRRRWRRGAERHAGRHRRRFAGWLPAATYTLSIHTCTCSLREACPFSIPERMCQRVLRCQMASLMWWLPQITIHANDLEGGPGGLTTGDIVRCAVKRSNCKATACKLVASRPADVDILPGKGASMDDGELASFEQDLVQTAGG